MSGQPDQLSQLLLEADGLLLLLHHHRDETPVDAIKLLRRKLELILALTDGLDEIEDSEEDPDEIYEPESDNQVTETEDELMEDKETIQYTPPTVAVETHNAELTPVHTEYTSLSVESHNTHTENPNRADGHASESLSQTRYNNHTKPEEREDIGDYMEETIEHAATPAQTSVNSSPAQKSEPETRQIEKTPVQQVEEVKHAIEEFKSNILLEESSTVEPSFYTPVSKPGVVTDEVVFMNETTVDTIAQDKAPTIAQEYPQEAPQRETSAPTAREVERRFIDDAPIYKPRLQNDDDSSWISTTSDITASRRPVSSVFNLNDKFRFRRELFGNSDAQYVECLDLLSAMTSIEEAKEYLYDDLQWDSENEDVKAFVELLSNYYRR